MSTLPYADPRLSPEQRADDLLARMTIQEKAGQLTQHFYMKMGDLPEGFDVETLPEEYWALMMQPTLVEAALDQGAAGSLPSVDVTNTSGRDADEVVQLYMHQRYGTSSRPIRELKGFERVAIPAGETRTVTFDLGPDELRYWSAATSDWVQDATTVDVYAGGSSTAELSTILTVVAR